MTRINELRHLFDLYTVHAPSLELLIKPRGDKLREDGVLKEYITFPAGMATPRYFVSLLQKPRTYVSSLTELNDNSLLVDIIDELRNRSYPILAVTSLLRKIERDYDTLRADTEMYAIIAQNPELKEIFPEQALFWKLLELSQGQKIYETTFKAPEECFEEAKRYALHAARAICEADTGIIYDESEDRIGILKQEENRNRRRLICVSASGVAAVETHRWEWISCRV